MILSAVFGVIYLDRQSGVIVSVALAILGALGWVGNKASDAKTEATVVRHQTNGTQAALVVLLERMSDQLARSTPPAPEAPSVVLEAVSDPVPGDG
jgi:hypothetical protein